MVESIITSNAFKHFLKHQSIARSIDDNFQCFIHLNKMELLNAQSYSLMNKLLNCKLVSKTTTFSLSFPAITPQRQNSRNTQLGYQLMQSKLVCHNQITTFQFTADRTLSQTFKSLHPTCADHHSQSHSFKTSS